MPKMREEIWVGGVLFLTTMFLWGQFAGGDYVFDIIKTYPDGVTEIESYAFANTDITSFEMPDSVRELGRYALEEVIICDNIKSIGAMAFAGCDNHTIYQKPILVGEYGNRSFRGYFQRRLGGYPLFVRAVCR